MKDLQPYANDFDKWVYSLLELLRTKYFDVSVNRGENKYTFFYSIKETSTQITSNLYLVPKRKEIPILELKGYYMTNKTPKQILELL